MHTARRISVKTQLTLTILLVIIISWIISTGLANYHMHLSMESMRKEMLSSGNNYPFVMPEPHFGISDFFFGPAGFLGSHKPHWFDRRQRSDMDRNKPIQPQNSPDAQQISPQPPKQDDRPANQGGNDTRNNRPFWPPPPESNQIYIMVIRIGVALILALLSGSWLSRKFSKPLTALAEGAEKFHSADFEYRIPINGENEFAQVAHSMNEMAKRVSEQISDLEDDAKRRRQFLADVAHELRSPVTTMKTMAGALYDGLAEDPERKQKAVGALVRTSERLLRLVVDLMDLAKLDLKELPLNLRIVDLREIINAAIQSHEEIALKAGISILPPQEGSPVMAKVDPDRITQVLDNLLGNAISYAGKKSQIRITMEDGKSIKLVIADNGRGIPSKDMDYIFDPFYRIDSVRTPGESHSGLGLRIVRGIIEAHGGKLVLSSVEGQGTSVEIRLSK